MQRFQRIDAFCRQRLLGFDAFLSATASWFRCIFACNGFLVLIRFVGSGFLVLMRFGRQRLLGFDAFLPATASWY
jgi:hypothetical protein